MYTDDTLCDASSNGCKKPVKGKLFAYACSHIQQLGLF